MTIIEKNIKDLKPYERNPRHNDNAVDAVAASIREFGFKVPIIIDKDGVIVAGHTRYKAAKKLRLNAVPCIIADDLTDEQIKAFRLADNKVSELAEWDIDLLDIELDDITDIDMSQFGFGEEEEPPILDDIDDNEEKLVSIKLTFNNYDEYAKHETELKEFAYSIGAAYSVIKV